MHFWRGSGGVRIAGDSWGPPNRPLALLLHGAGQTRHAWKGAGEQLGAAGYHAVALDARGHGDSEWAPDGLYGPDNMVEDLKCVLAAFPGRRPVLIGASMGGDTSLMAVGEGRVDAVALIMVDVAPRIETAGVARIHDFMNRRPEGFDSLEDVARAIAAYQPQRPRKQDLDGLAKNVRVAPNGKYRWHWDPEFRPERVDLVERKRRLEACAANLRLPTLLVRGVLSDVLTEEGACEFLRLCPHAESVDVRGAAHMVAGDRNDIFGSALRAFLARVPELQPDEPSSRGY
jgi:non-heme chloroperoxidase